MPVEQQQIDRAAQIRNGLEQLKNSLDYDAKKKEIAEIDKQMAESGFWDDQEKSQTVVARIKALKALVKPMDEIITNIADTVDVVDVIKPIYNFKASESVPAWRK